MKRHGRKFLFWGAFGLCFLAACKKSAQEPAKTTPESIPAFQPPTLEALPQGLWWLYNQQYAQARRIFSTYTEEHPTDPAGFFYLTATAWWQLAEDFELSQPAVVKQFELDSQQTIDVAEKLLKVKKDKAVLARAHLFEGGAWGLRGRFGVTQHEWLKAYQAGKRGRAELRKALALDPKLYDAYLGLGIYDYYAATLKGAQALLSKLLMHGDRKRGLKEIKLAMEHGERSRTEAMIFLIDIYISWEKTPAEAVRLASELHRDYPQSPAMHLALISSLAANKQWKDLNQEADTFLSHSQDGGTFYTSRHRLPGLYYAGLGALHSGDPNLCIQNMNAILGTANLPEESRWRSFAYLRRGEAFDLQKDRPQAKENYAAVLKRSDVWGSHEEAKANLKQPFHL